jgi:SAM domain (Sterile alpha motif)
VCVYDQLESWLDGIGLAQYATAFAENAIDFEILPDLTEADLRNWALHSAIENAFSERSRAVRRGTSRRAGHGPFPAGIRGRETPTDRPFLRSRRLDGSGGQARS